MPDDALPGMSSEFFLVATTEHLLGMDGTGRCHLVHTGAGLYYGLSQDDRHLYAACRHETVGPDNAALRALENGSILVFDISSLDLLDEIRPPFPLRDVHGISCFDGCLWVTCSYDNMIAVLDLDRRSWWRWYPAVDPLAKLSDGCADRTTVVVGANGAGKSTMMKLMARVLPPTSGRVLVRGKVAPMTELSAGFDPDPTGLENTVFYGTLLGRSPSRTSCSSTRCFRWATRPSRRSTRAVSTASSSATPPWSW